MIVVTGAAGFIGSCMISKLNEENFNNIIAVDLFHEESKSGNLKGKKIMASVDRGAFIPWLEENADAVEFIFHLGARTDTSTSDVLLLNELNTEYSKLIWDVCVREQIPLIYASSAATYGNGAQGYTDDHSLLNKLQPLNAYAKSKHDFDLWAINQDKSPFFWAGLKFFNVYGPNEYHKGRMSSVIFHAYHEIVVNESIKLFRSHQDEYPDGEQKRDFVFVNDVVDVMFWMMHHRKNSGIYNVGTGNAESFNSLAKHLFDQLERPLRIKYTDIPVDIRENYQYYTKADISKLKSIGCPVIFRNLEEGISEYLNRYLFDKIYF